MVKSWRQPTTCARPGCADYAGSAADLRDRMSQLTIPQDFDLLLDFAFGIADRGVPLSLVVMAPDRLPEVPGPDVVASLLRLESDLANRTRRSDRLTRRTGSLFVALLVDCNRQGALIFADRMTEASSAFSLMSGLSVSCGIACYREGMKSPKDLEEAAKRALEVAHSSGGNRIEIAEA